jgi:hypothetical protein
MEAARVIDLNAVRALRAQRPAAPVQAPRPPSPVVWVPMVVWVPVCWGA